MTTETYKIVATLEPTAGFDNETVTNTFWIHKTSAGAIDQAADLAVLHPIVRDFYIAKPAASNYAVGGYLSAALDRAANKCTLRGYTTGPVLASGFTGSPDYTSTFTLPTAASTENTVNQAAVVLTLEGRGAAAAAVQIGGERPKQRKRGRLFIGGLNVAALDRTASQNVRPSIGFMGDVMESAEVMQDALNAAGFIWSVFSRADEAVYGIVGVSIDNSVDTLRKRKIAPTSRLTRSFAPVPALALGA